LARGLPLLWRNGRGHLHGHFRLLAFRSSGGEIAPCHYGYGVGQKSIAGRRPTPRRRGATARRRRAVQLLTPLKKRLTGPRPAEERIPESRIAMRDPREWS